MELFKDGYLPIIIFTDGACSGNPGPGGYGAVIVTPDGNVQELGDGFKSTTNNRMEMSSVIHALKYTNKLKEDVHIFTDSVYVIRGATEWIHGWRRRGWKTAEGQEVANRDMWEEMYSQTAHRKNIKWHYVRGHTGVAGNERCDEIAVGFTKGPKPKLYSGPLSKYDVPIQDIPDNTDLPEMKPKAGPKQAAYSYLSMVGGVPQRHANWSECEKRVKGISGARFKKAMNEGEESEILAQWGVSL